MLKLLQISDLHILEKESDTLLGINTEYYFRQVLKYAHAEHGPFDLILISGDLAQDPCPDTYNRILKELREYRTLTLCLPGNHDDFGLMQALLENEVATCNKHLLIKDWQIIALSSQKLNSPVGLLSQEELNFLERCLTAYPNIPALITMHHNCVPCGSPWLDTMQIENSVDLLKLFDRHPQVKVVTYGHVHQAMSVNHKGIAIFATSATCFQFVPNSLEFSIEDGPAGYRIFELYDNGKLESASYRIAEPLQGLDMTAHNY